MSPRVYLFALMTGATLSDFGGLPVVVAKFDSDKFRRYWALGHLPPMTARQNDEFGKAGRSWWLVECESAEAGRAIIAHEMAARVSGDREESYGHGSAGRILDSGGAR